MERVTQRQGFLVSVTAHLVILMALASQTVVVPPAKPAAPPPPAERKETVFLPSPEVLRQLMPRPPQAAAPRPMPTPPQPPPAAVRQKDAISIGAPSEERSKGPLILRKEDDLTATPKGRPNLAPAETGPSIAGSLRRLEQRLQDTGPSGLPTGTGQQMGPLFFDPEGADFTLWINHAKNELYRNWIVPEPALLGFHGHVDLEFSVERDGTLTNLKMLKRSGTTAFDRAAQNALLGSRFLPLPPDFAPPRVTMQVTFYYNEGPQGS